MDAISLFSGAGGDSLGMENAGLNVIAFSEFNKDAIKTHQAAFSDSVWLGSGVKGDITKIPDSEFQPYTGKVKVVFAGFPCQGFSNAGKKDENDPRNKMFYQFLRVATIVQPDWIMGENVAGLLTRKTDDGHVLGNLDSGPFTGTRDVATRDRVPADDADGLREAGQPPCQILALGFHAGPSRQALRGSIDQRR